MASLSAFMVGNHRQYPSHYMETSISTYIDTCRYTVVGVVIFGRGRGGLLTWHVVMFYSSYKVVLCLTPVILLVKGEPLGGKGLEKKKCLCFAI